MVITDKDLEKKVDEIYESILEEMEYEGTGDNGPAYTFDKDDIKNSLEEAIIKIRSTYEDAVESAEYETECLQDELDDLAGEDLQEAAVIEEFNERIKAYRNGRLRLTEILK